MARSKRLLLGRALQLLGSVLMGSVILLVVLLIGFSQYAPLGPPDFLLPILVIVIVAGAGLGVAGIILAPSEIL
jgi:hypothetical protein